MAVGSGAAPLTGRGKRLRRFPWRRTVGRPCW